MASTLSVLCGFLVNLDCAGFRRKALRIVRRITVQTGKKEQEIWPEMPRYFAAAIAIHYARGDGTSVGVAYEWEAYIFLDVACQWGWHISGWGLFRSLLG